jgi:hypothetical protein
MGYSPRLKWLQMPGQRALGALGMQQRAQMSLELWRRVADL